MRLAPLTALRLALAARLEQCARGESFPTRPTANDVTPAGGVHISRILFQMIPVIRKRSQVAKWPVAKEIAVQQWTWDYFRGSQHLKLPRKARVCAECQQCRAETQRSSCMHWSAGRGLLHRSVWRREQCRCGGILEKRTTPLLVGVMYILNGRSVFCPTWRVEKHTTHLLKPCPACEQMRSVFLEMVCLRRNTLRI